MTPEEFEKAWAEKMATYKEKNDEVERLLSMVLGSLDSPEWDSADKKAERKRLLQESRNLLKEARESLSTSVKSFKEEGKANPGGKKKDTRWRGFGYTGR